MDRSVQVVDDRRSDEALRQDDLHRRLRVARVAIDHADERVVRRAVDIEAADGGRQRLGQAAERTVAALQIVTRLFTGSAGVIGGKALRGVGKEELVRLFNRVALRAERRDRFGGLWRVGTQIQNSVISVFPNLKSEF